ncbi:MAG: hypothetical protein OSJ56_14640, partial [Prevotella sp.]|nr:hypothetical protein [Prevotella sp.]
MKHIITIVLTLFLAAFAMAQERNYISICGKTKTSIKWTEEHKSSNTNLSISLNNGIYSISGKFNGKQISK